MATVHSKKTFPSKTVGGKSVPGKSPPPLMPMKTTPTSATSQKTTPLQNSQKMKDTSSQLNHFLPPCSHLNKVLASNAKDMVLKTYKAAMKTVITKIKIDSTQNNNLKYIDRNGKKVNNKILRKLLSNVLRCKDCKEANHITHDRVFMCLQCTNIGCFSEKHAYHHAKTTGHVFGKF